MYVCVYVKYIICMYILILYISTYTLYLFIDLYSIIGYSIICIGISVNNALMEEQLAGIDFYSATYRLWKVPGKLICLYDNMII
jgi:hypothetical protein